MMKPQNYALNTLKPLIAKVQSQESCIEIKSPWITSIQQYNSILHFARHTITKDQSQISSIDLKKQLHNMKKHFNQIQCFMKLIMIIIILKLNIGNF